MDLFCVRCQFIFMFLVYPGQPGTVLQSGQPAYMYQTAGTNPTPYPGLAKATVRRLYVILSAYHQIL